MSSNTLTYVALKQLNVGDKIGTSKESKVTVRLFKKGDSTPIDASQYYDIASSNSGNEDNNEESDTFVEFMSKTVNENLKDEILRFKQLIK